MTFDEITQLLAEQMAEIKDRHRHAAISAFLVTPERQVRTWGYGPGEFECWTIARDDLRGTVLVYCQGAFCDPWGSLASDSRDLGMDSDWFSTLDDAFIATLWIGPLPPDYEVA